MKVSLIVAVSENGVIGRSGQLPWRLPVDLRRFRALTMGKPIVMGRRTWESIGRPLPGRMNIIVTRRPDFRADGVIVAHSLMQALERAEPAAEVMVIGGASLYAEALPLARTIYWTEVHAYVEGDTCFPPWDRTGWREVARERVALEASGQPACSFVIWEREPDFAKLRGD